MTQINTLYVASLNYRTSESDFREHFEEVGRVRRVEIKKDERGRSLGFGYVEYERPQDAEFAVTHFDGTQLDGKRIHVEFCKPNLKWNLEQRQLEKRALLRCREREDAAREHRHRRHHHRSRRRRRSSSADEAVAEADKAEESAKENTESSGAKAGGVLQISGAVAQEFVRDSASHRRRHSHRAHSRHK